MSDTTHTSDTPNEAARPATEDAAIQAAAQAFVGMEEQLTARQMELMQARFTAMQQEANRRAEDMFNRWIVEQEQRQKVTAYAQHVTTATFNRPYALPIEAATLETFLLGLNTDQRTSAQGLFNRILDAGLISFEEVGSQGGADEREVSAKEAFDAAVTAKMTSGGLTRMQAMDAVRRDQPDVYEAYHNESSRRGAVAAPTKRAPARTRKGA